MSATSESSDIRILRTYDAPLKAVWDAWTDPDQTALWWGPRGFTLTTHRKDLRTGGGWDYTMHGPDGTDYPNKTVCLDVQPMNKLVYDHGGNDAQPPMFRVTVVFDEADGRTRMDMRMTLPSPEAAAQTRQFIRQAGGDATWDRLAEHLAKRLSDRERFVINRSFDAPLGRMFAIWTDPAHVARWAAPTGCEMSFIRADVRAGGGSFYSMSSPGGTMHGRTHYEKIRDPDLIVYTQQFCDEHEQITRHPMAPTWPETMRTTVELNAEGPDRTRVTLTWEAAGETTAEEVATFAGARAGMTQGWTGSFDKLEEVLAARP